VTCPTSATSPLGSVTWRSTSTSGSDQAATNCTSPEGIPQPSSRSPLQLSSTPLKQSSGPLGTQGALTTSSSGGVSPTAGAGAPPERHPARDRKSTRLNSSHVKISYAVFCVKK